MAEFDSGDDFDLDVKVTEGDGTVSPQSTPTIIYSIRISIIVSSILTTNACGSTPTTGRC
jgi:hypothetical protein